MDQLTKLLTQINSIVWGGALLVLLMKTGIYESVIFFGKSFKYEGIFKCSNNNFAKVLLY